MSPDRPDRPAGSPLLTKEEFQRFVDLATRPRADLTSAERRELAALVRRLLASPDATTN